MICHLLASDSRRATARRGTGQVRSRRAVTGHSRVVEVREGAKLRRQFEARTALLERGSLCDVQEALTTLDKVLPELRTDVKP